MDRIKNFSFYCILTVIAAGMTVKKDPGNFLFSGSPGCYTINCCGNIQIYDVIVPFIQDFLDLAVLGPGMTEICDGKDTGTISFKIYFQLCVHFVGKKIHL